MILINLALAVIFMNYERIKAGGSGGNKGLGLGHHACQRKAMCTVCSPAPAHPSPPGPCLSQQRGTVLACLVRYANVPPMTCGRFSRLRTTYVRSTSMHTIHVHVWLAHRAYCCLHAHM